MPEHIFMTLVEKSLDRLLTEIEAHSVTSMQLVPKEILPPQTPPRHRAHWMHDALVEHATTILLEQEPRLLKDRFNLTAMFPQPEQVLGALFFDIVRSIHEGNEKAPLSIQKFTGNKGYLIHARAHHSYCVDPHKDCPTKAHDMTDQELNYLAHAVHDSNYLNVAFERYRQASSFQVFVK